MSKCDNSKVTASSDEPGDNDIRLVQGREYENTKGVRLYRQLISDQKSSYRQAMKEKNGGKKDRIAQKVVDELQKHGCRLFHQDCYRKWVESTGLDLIRTIKCSLRAKDKKRSRMLEEDDASTSTESSLPVTKKAKLETKEDSAARIADDFWQRNSLAALLIPAMSSSSSPSNHGEIQYFIDKLYSGTSMSPHFVSDDEDDEDLFDSKDLEQIAFDVVSDDGSIFCSDLEETPVEVTISPDLGMIPA